MLLDYLRKNPGLKIISLILAIILWSYVKYTSTPYASLTSEAGFTIPLTIQGKEENLAVLEVPDQVTLTVNGAPDNLKKLNSANFKASINLDNRKAGTYTVPVKVIPPPEVKVAAVNPAKVQVILDPMEKRLMPVKIETRGSIAGGFILGKMKSKPESVMVSGAKSYIGRIKEVRAISEVDGADTDLVQKVAVEAFDEKGSGVSGIKLEPGSVRVSINIQHEVVNKQVPVSPDITGNPAKGYKISKVEVTPPTATIQYPYTLQPAPEFVKTQKVNIEGSKGSVAKEAGITTSRDISLINPKNVKILVTITKVKEKKTSDKKNSK